MFNIQVFPEGVLKIIKTLKQNGFKCYAVGGCIRDLLLGVKVEEWDLTTDARPDEVSKLFEKVIPTGIDFGTVTILLDDGQYEVTTFRSDERYTDGRHPAKVTYTKDIHEDLSRRDFTINAIAYDPLTQELLDDFDGQKDLTDRLVRSVGDPIERFNEDGLRPFRACRFAAKLGFEIESKTFEAIPQALDRVKLVSVERIRDEILKMLEADKPSSGFELMRQSELLKICIPELEEGYEVEQPKPFHKYDVYWHSLLTCDAISKEKPILRLAGLLHDIAKPRCKKGATFYNHDQLGAEMAKEIMRRLRFSNENIDNVQVLVKNHMFDYQSEWGDNAVRRFIRRVGEEYLDDLFELREADVMAMEREIGSEYLKELKDRIQKVFEEESALHIRDLEVDGEDVMRVLGIGPGPKVGEVLNYLLERVLDNPELNKKEKLIELIKMTKIQDTITKQMKLQTSKLKIQNKSKIPNPSA